MALYAGKLVEEAPTATILKQPKHPYSQFLISSLPSFDERKLKESIPNRPPALDKPPVLPFSSPLSSGGGKLQPP
ncbi:MAG: hypothetical protein R2865_16075 [Deinococcales bacterium]